jgi:hypothetical protein
MRRVGFKPMIPVFERAKAVHALGRPAIVIGFHAEISADKFPSSCAVADGMCVRTTGQLDVVTYDEFLSRSECTYHA